MSGMWVMRLVPGMTTMRGHLASVQRSQRTAYADRDLSSVTLSDRGTNGSSHDCAKQDPEPLFHVIGPNRACQRRHCQGDRNCHYDSPKHRVPIDLVHSHCPSSIRADYMDIKDTVRLPFTSFCSGNPEVRHHRCHQYPACPLPRQARCPYRRLPLCVDGAPFHSRSPLFRISTVRDCTSASPT